MGGRRDLSGWRDLRADRETGGRKDGRTIERTHSMNRQGLNGLYFMECKLIENTKEKEENPKKQMDFAFCSFVSDKLGMGDSF